MPLSKTPRRTSSQVESEDPFYSTSQMTIVQCQHYQRPQKQQSSSVGHIDYINDRYVSERFQPALRVGSGACSNVFVGHHPGFHGVVAAKVMNKDYVKRFLGRNGYKNEIKNLRRAQGPFTAKLLDSFETNDHVWIVTPYYAGGDFQSYLTNSGPFTLLTTQFYTAELACALAHLHSNHIFFGDLKPENIVISSSGHIRLIDFGLSIHELSSSRCTLDANTGKPVFQTESGTLAYASPELFQRDPVGYEADWWALGAITFEMITGASPFYNPEDTDPQVLCTRVCTQEVNFEGLSVELGDANSAAESFLKGLLEKNPVNRLGRHGSEEVLRHPFLPNLDWSLLAAEFYEPPVTPCVQGRFHGSIGCEEEVFEELAPSRN